MACGSKRGPGSSWLFIKLLVQVGDVFSVRFQAFLGISQLSFQSTIHSLKLVQFNLLQLKFLLSLNLFFLELIDDIHLHRYSILLTLDRLLDVLHLRLLDFQFLLELLVVALLLVDDVVALDDLLLALL